MSGMGNRSFFLALVVACGAVRVCGGQDLPAPADRIELVGGDKLLVQPLFFFAPAGKGKEPLVVEPLDAPGKTRSLAGENVAGIDWYESWALRRIDDHLAQKTKDTEERLAAAEKMLLAVLHFHHARRDGADRKLPPWRSLGRNLLDRLAEVRADLLEAAAATVGDEEAWKQVLARTESHLEAYPAESKVHRAVEKVWGARLAVLTGRKEWPAARAWLDRCEEEFPDGPGAAAGKEQLRAHAAGLVKTAEGRPATEALVLLKEAYQAWPSLPGLADDVARRQGSYRVLHVGVGSTPVLLSPAAACTEAERLVVPLLFESLLGHRADTGGGYEPVLADRLPSAGSTRLVWNLRRDAYFADGRRLTARDLRHTWRLLTLPEQARRDPTWADQAALPLSNEDPFRWELDLEQGLLDPYGLGLFPVLPSKVGERTLPRVDEAAFARSPLGSGPFRFDGSEKDAVVLRRNVHHRDRLPLARPQVREIRFHPWSNIEELGKKPPEVLADVSDALLPAVRKLGYNLRTVTPPRVQFLAVNHRRAELAEVDLRRALAHALNREKLLDEFYREADPGGSGRTAFHFPASGLFPPGSWACCSPPRVPADPYDPDRARSSAKKAVGERKTLRFSLKYPAEDSQAALACRAMAGVWKKVFDEAGCTLTVDLQAVPAAKLRAQVYEHDYDLAWWDLDFPDGNHRIWPLFDPRPPALARGGSNFLGYQGDAKMQALLLAARAYRSFTVAREQHHNLHAYLYERMPVIPLWQLQRHFAFRPSVRPGPLNAHAPLADAARWQVD